jgi:hypothetical protein
MMFLSALAVRAVTATSAAIAIAMRLAVLPGTGRVSVRQVGLCGNRRGRAFRRLLRRAIVAPLARLALLLMLMAGLAPRVLTALLALNAPARTPDFLIFRLGRRGGFGRRLRNRRSVGSGSLGNRRVGAFGGLGCDCSFSLLRDRTFLRNRLICRR